MLSLRTLLLLVRFVRLIGRLLTLVIAVVALLIIALVIVALSALLLRLCSGSLLDDSDSLLAIYLRGLVGGVCLVRLSGALVLSRV